MGDASGFADHVFGLTHLLGFREHLRLVTRYLGWRLPTTMEFK